LASEIGDQRRRIRPHRPLEVVGRNIGHAPRGFSLAVGQASPSAAALRLGGSAPSAYRRSGFPRVCPETCLHGLNAVWCDEIWCGVDPRGDKPSTAGPFDPDCEWLAYSVDAGRGERDYRDVFAEPLPCVSAALHGSCTVGELDRNCPRPRLKQAASAASNIIEGKLFHAGRFATRLTGLKCPLAIVIAGRADM